MQPTPPPITWQTASWTATGSGLFFTIPEPVSANRLWRRGKGRTYKAQAAKDATNAAALLFGRCAAMPGEVSVRMIWVRSRKTGDVDNKVKATLDMLRGIAYADDDQVARLSIERVDDPTQAAGMYCWVESVVTVRAA